MRLALLTTTTAVLTATASSACTFCDGGVRSRQTLRMHLSQSQLVVHGRLENPRLDPATDAGTTDLRVGTVLKADPAAAGRPVVPIARYLPVVGDTPPDFLLFAAVRGGDVDPAYGLPAGTAVVDYLAAAATVDAADGPTRLAFFFARLDSPDPTVSADAFAEFARAGDADIVAAASRFDPAKVRAWLADPATPADRLGVYAFVLGACGGPGDAAFLKSLVNGPSGERLSASLGGVLTGLILLDPAGGWEQTRMILADAKRPYAERLNAIGTVRFFQATRPAAKADVLRCYAALLPFGDLADVAVEDLRRWGCWELTADVFAQWGKPTHAAPLVRRGIVRYALSCPSAEAKAFLSAARRDDAKLVEAVAESLALYDPVTPRR